MPKEKTIPETVPTKRVRAVGQPDEIRSLYVEGRSYNLDALSDDQLAFLLASEAIAVDQAEPTQV